MREGIRVHVGQLHSTVDESKVHVVMLYCPLSWWMIHRRSSGGGYAFMRDNPFLQWMKVGFIF